MAVSSAFDLFVIGGGSGGIATARRAAQYGAKVGIAEGKRLGGTCVNVGCVPKKMMWWASTVRETIEESHHYGFDVTNGGWSSQGRKQVAFSWSELKRRRDANILRLNGIYSSNLEKSGISSYAENAAFTGARSADGTFKLKVGSEEVTTKRVLVAVGGRPKPIGIPGEELCITSDGFFALDNQPKKAAVIGAGYIAVELAGVFNGLGTETHLFVRGNTALRKFDEMLATSLNDEMKHAGVIMHPGSTPEKVVKDSTTGKLTLHTVGNPEPAAGFDLILIAVGREPYLDPLNLPASGVTTMPGNNYIKVNELQETSVQDIYALGDVCGKVELTPMAIAAGRRLADRLYGGMTSAKADYDNVPTVVFSHPPIGTIGLTEAEAVAKYGEANLNVYRNVSVNLYYNVFDIAPADKPKTRMKLICLKQENDKIIGLHVIGMGADEMLQGFGVAIKMGATKLDFDKCIAIHPSAAEEMVTLAPWGLSQEPKPSA